MRASELEARRRALLARCEAQRAEISLRLGQLSGGGWARAAVAAAAGPAEGGTHGGRHPLAWLLAVAGVLLLRNPRSALSVLVRTRTTLTWLRRAVEVLSLLGILRKTTTLGKRRLRRAR